MFSFHFNAQFQNTIMFFNALLPSPCKNSVSFRFISRSIFQARMTLNYHKIVPVAFLLKKIWLIFSAWMFDLLLKCLQSSRLYAWTNLCEFKMWTELELMCHSFNMFWEDALKPEELLFEKCIGYFSVCRNRYYHSSTSFHSIWRKKRTYVADIRKSFNTTVYLKPILQICYTSYKSRIFKKKIWIRESNIWINENIVSSIVQIHSGVRKDSLQFI